MKTDKEIFEETLDKICDEENCEPIALFSSTGEEILFEQVAVVPKNEKLYIILKPVKPMQGVGEDEGLVFFVDEENCRYELVTDEKIIDEIFDVYDSLVESMEEDGE